MNQNSITAVNHGRYLSDKLKTICHTIVLFKKKMNHNKIKLNFISNHSDFYFSRNVIVTNYLLPNFIFHFSENCG